MYKLLLHDHPQEVTRKELHQWLDELPDERRTKALRHRFLIDQVQSALAYRLLRQGLYEGYGIEGNVRLTEGPCGKPLLTDYPDLHFNLSHCRGGVICALGDEPVGVDIEQVSAGLPDPDLCHQCFSRSETDDILHAANPARRFLQGWTMKESYLKLTGEGLTGEGLPHLLTPQVQEQCQWQSFEHGPLTYTVCTYRNQH